MIRIYADVYVFTFLPGPNASLLAFQSSPLSCTCHDNLHFIPLTFLWKYLKSFRQRIAATAESINCSIPPKFDKIHRRAHFCEMLMQIPDPANMPCDSNECNIQVYLEWVAMCSTRVMKIWYMQLDHYRQTACKGR